MLKILPVVALAMTVAACAKETPATAIYALAHDLEHDLTAGACERMYSSHDLPPEIAAALSIRSRTGGHQGLLFDCSGALGTEGPLRSLGFDEPRVRSIAPVDVEPSAGISDAATAQVAIDGAEPVTVKLVKFEGTWRVVVDVDRGRLAHVLPYGRARL